VWHSLLALVYAGLALWVMTAAQFAGASPWWRGIGVFVLLLGAAVSARAAFFIFRRDRRGRFTSIAVNYLSLVASLILDLHFLGIFLGIDALGSTFSRGLPYLAIVLVGYLIGTIGDRYEGRAREQVYRNIGRWAMIAGFVLFLFFVGTLDAALWLVGRLTEIPVTIGLTVMVIFCGVMLWAMWQRPVADAVQADLMQDEILNGYLFLSPNVLGFLIFFAGPLIFSLYVSFTNSDAFSKRDFVGLGNYAQLLNFTVKTLAAPDQPAREVMDVKIYDEVARFGNTIIGAQDRLFIIALGNTFKFCLLAVPLSVIPALLLATLLNSKLPGMKFYRTIYFIPSIAAVVGISLVWQFMYNASIGWINYFITLGVNLLNTIFGGSIADPQIKWLSSVDTALLAVVLVAAWQTLGFNSVLFLAGLQNIPGELYEAATVDGANTWRKFWSITLPLLAPTTFFVVTTTTIQAFQAFEQIYVLTNPAGAPNNSTLTMVVYLYQRGFQDFRQGYASAVAWVLFIVIFAFTLVQFRQQRQSSLYES
jgi:ABC-type sugar transport system permease subunit